LNPSGGTAPYTYAWSANAGGVTASTLTNLPVGKYNVTVTESGANRCSAVSFVEIEEPEFSVHANILVKENSGQQPDDGIICDNGYGISRKHFVYKNQNKPKQTKTNQNKPK
jgi:hypothetical protein